MALAASASASDAPADGAVAAAAGAEAVDWRAARPKLAPKSCFAFCDAGEWAVTGGRWKNIYGSLL